MKRFKLYFIISAIISLFASTLYFFHANASSLLISYVLVITLLCSLFLFIINKLFFYQHELLKTKEILLHFQSRSQLLEVVAYGVITINKRDKITFANKATCDITGYDIDELVGQNFYTFLQKSEAELNGLKDIPYCEIKTNNNGFREAMLCHKEKHQILIEYTTYLLEEKGEVKEKIITFHNINQQKKVEKALQDQFHFTEALLNAIPSPIFYKDIYGKFQGCNTAFEEFTGQCATDIIGKSAFDIAPADIARIYHRTDVEALTYHTVQTYEAKLHCAQGDLQDIIFNKAYYTNAEGNVVGLVGVMTNITNLKKTEKALRESKYRYETIFNDVTIGIFDKDFSQVFEKIQQLKKTECQTITEFQIYLKDETNLKAFLELFKINDVNQTALTLFGIKNKAEVLKMPLMCFFPSVEPIIKGLYAIWEQQKTFQFETIYHTVDKRELILLISCPIPSTIEEAKHVPVTLLDITARKKAEEKLRVSEKYKRMLIEESLIGFLLVSQSGVIKEVNPAFANILGYKPEDIINKLNYWDITPEKYHDAESHYLFNLPLGDRYGPFKKQFIHKLGHQVPVRMSGLIIEIEAQHCIWSNIEDITEQLKNEAKLRHAKEAAEVANRAKSTFLANMSHELRTPLNAILGYAQILGRDNNLLTEQKEGIDIIYRAGEYLLTLINDILDLSKIEAGRIGFHPQEFYLDSFIKDLTSIFALRAREKGVEFYHKILSDLPSVIYTDEKRLRQILINLLSNAIKFTEQGTVTFQMSINIIEEKKFLRFEVQDDGIGIAPTEMQKIFLPFQQVGTLDYQMKGTGLGLAISKKLVDIMEGEIHVASTMGKGSTFWVLLPFKKILPQTKKMVKRQNEKTLIKGFHGKRRRILIADDTAENRWILTEMLKPLGFELMEVENGQEAVTQACKWHPDLILMDIVMPVVDGWTATKQIRHTHKLNDILIIAISASAFDYHQHRSLEVGCNDFLPKPIHTKSLLECLQRHLQLNWIVEVADHDSPLLENDDEVSHETEAIDTAIKYFSETQIGCFFDLTMQGDIQGIREYIENLAKDNDPDHYFSNYALELLNNLKMRELRELAKQLQTERNK